MQRLTTAGRLLITALVLVALYFGFRYYTANHAPASTAQTTAPADGGANAPTGPTSVVTVPTDTTITASGASGTFTYTAKAPVDGKLKGVVELGASGFNSFIVRIDAEKRWKLEKADFGNSLVMENMATDTDIRDGLKRYIGQMLDFGVNGRDIHFVVSSGAAKAENTAKITKALKSLNYFVNTVTPAEEGTLGLRCVLPAEYETSSFVLDIGSGNTKISWKTPQGLQSVETYGAKYFQQNIPDEGVFAEAQIKASEIPKALRNTCFIIGGVPFELAKIGRKGKERFTILNAPNAYQLESAKSKAGLNIYRAVAEATNCQQFVFDWDANFTIGYLLSLPL